MIAYRELILYKMAAELRSELARAYLGVAWLRTVLWVWQDTGRKYSLWTNLRRTIEASIRLPIKAIEVLRRSRP